MAKKDIPTGEATLIEKTRKQGEKLRRTIVGVVNNGVFTPGIVPDAELSACVFEMDVNEFCERAKLIDVLDNEGLAKALKARTGGKRENKRETERSQRIASLFGGSAE